MAITFENPARDRLVDADTFSFDQATLASNLQNNPIHRAYDRERPSTWPLVTLENINKHCRGKYGGIEMLPRYLAYDFNVMAIFLEKHSKKELSYNGTAESLYSRYPCNFTMRDRVKGYIGMTDDKVAWFESNMAARQKAEVKKEKQPERGESSRSTTAFPMRPARTESLCQTPACVKEREEKDRLKSALHNREEDLKAVRQDIRDMVERNTTEVGGLRRELEQARRAAHKRSAIQLDWIDSGMRKMVKERDIRIAELEKMCEELKMGNKESKGGLMADKRARVEDYFSEDEERPEKRARTG